MGRVAAVVGPALAAMIPAAMPLVGFADHQTLRWALVILPSVALAGVLAWFTPWQRRHDEALLIVPVSGFVCLGVFGALSDGRAGVYGGYVVLLFLYVG
jgi:hypothetical protein